MASREKHIITYQKNKDLSNSNLISQEEHYDWKVTMTYYSALHLIDSTYADNQFHPENHEVRKNCIRRIHGEPMSSTYILLEKLSRKSRYDCVKIKDKHVRSATMGLERLENQILNR